VSDDFTFVSIKVLMKSELSEIY